MPLPGPAAHDALGLCPRAESRGGDEEGPSTAISITPVCIRSEEVVRVDLDVPGPTRRGFRPNSRRTGRASSRRISVALD